MRLGLLATLLVSLLLIGCDSYSSEGGSGYSEPPPAESGQAGVDPTPEKLDGSESVEFENEDIDQANSASQAVQDYCSGAASEAQEVGCLSHVDESDIP